MSLYITPKSANLTHNTQMLGKMDPYILFVGGCRQLRSKTIKGGGKTPKWEGEEFSFTQNCGNISITLWDQDICKDDIIGSATVDMSKFIGNTNQQEQKVSLEYNGKYAGTIILSIRYVPLKHQLFQSRHDINSIIYPNNKQNPNSGYPINPLNQIANHLQNNR